jgi:uncharacterized protein YneF (UPF0154 family)
MRNGIICAAAAAAAEIISGNKLHQLLYIASRYIEFYLRWNPPKKKKKIKVPSSYIHRMKNRSRFGPLYLSYWKAILISLPPLPMCVVRKY